VLYSPFRQEVASDYLVYTGTANTLPSDSTDPLATVPVRYANRTGDQKYQAESIAGWYYLAVKLGATPEGGDTNGVPVRIDLTVTGTKEAGPTYTTAGNTFDGNPSASPSGTPEKPLAAADSSPLGTAMWIIIPTAVVLGGVAVAVTLVLRRRRSVTR